MELVVYWAIWYTKLMRLLALFFILIQFESIYAKTLQKALDRFSAAGSIQFDIKKTDEKIILGTKTETKGLLKYQKNKIYILQNGEKKVEIYYADKNLSMIEYPDLDFGKDGKRKITILKNPNTPLIKSLLSLFSDSQSFMKDFAVASEKKSDNLIVYDLKTKQNNIKNLVLKVNAADSNLVELSFVDDVETKTTIEFSNLKINSKMNKNDFQYKRLKTDEVMIQ